MRRYGRRVVFQQFLGIDLHPCLKIAGTAGTNGECACNPLSRLNKTVPITSGDKPLCHGDTGGSHFHWGLRPSGRAVVWCLVLTKASFCSEVENLQPAAHTRLGVAHFGQKRQVLIDQVQILPVLSGSNPQVLFREDVACSQKIAPYRVSDSHAPTIHGPPPCNQNRCKLQS